jgi:hypothetical protein
MPTLRSRFMNRYLSYTRTRSLLTPIEAARSRSRSRSNLAVAVVVVVEAPLVVSFVVDLGSHHSHHHHHHHHHHYYRILLVLINQSIERDVYTVHTEKQTPALYSIIQPAESPNKKPARQSK